MTKRLWIQDHEHYLELFYQIKKLINFNEKYCVDSCFYMGVNKCFYMSVNKCCLFNKNLTCFNSFLRNKIMITNYVRCQTCIEIFGE